MEDLYNILGVPSTASAEEIKQKFRFLAQAYHPDKFASDDHRRQAENEFKRISAAYQTLSNPDQRAIYDSKQTTESEQHNNSTTSGQDYTRPAAPRVNIKSKPSQSATNKTQFISVLIIFVALCGLISLFVLSLWLGNSQSSSTFPNTMSPRKAATIKPTYTDVFITSTVKLTSTFLPTPTATPFTTFMSGGDIGKGWSNNDRRIDLVKVYRTEMIDGIKPFGERLGGYRGGYTQFLVIELRLERFTQGYDEYDLTDFWLSSYSNDGYLEYGADQYLFDSPRLVRVYFQEEYRVRFAFEVSPNSHNFILCYQTSVGIDFSGKIVSECGSEGYQFKFGD